MVGLTYANIYDDLGNRLQKRNTYMLILINGKLTNDERLFLGLIIIEGSFGKTKVIVKLYRSFNIQKKEIVQILIFFNGSDYD